MSDALERACTCNHLPDACTNEDREDALLKRQDNDDGRPWIRRFVSRERYLLVTCAVLILCLNLSTGRYLLYPFQIFMVWVHEMCHGIAAILTGGSVSRLQVFKDGSGLAFTSTNGSDFARGFVASAGYPGTAVLGCILLLFRRTTLGPTYGTIFLGTLMILSTIFLVRNEFGCIILSIEGAVLLLAAWKFPAVWLDNLFTFLAATCCLNAVESVHDVFAADEIYYNNGEVVTTTDAHAVAEAWGGDYRGWATAWFVASIASAACGIIFAFDAKEPVANSWKGFQANV